MPPGGGRDARLPQNEPVGGTPSEECQAHPCPPCIHEHLFFQYVRPGGVCVGPGLSQPTVRAYQHASAGCGGNSARGVSSVLQPPVQGMYHNPAVWGGFAPPAWEARAEDVEGRQLNRCRMPAFSRQYCCVSRQTVTHATVARSTHQFDAALRRGNRKPPVPPVSYEKHDMLRQVNTERRRVRVRSACSAATARRVARNCLEMSAGTMRSLFSVVRQNVPRSNEDEPPYG